MKRKLLFTTLNTGLLLAASSNFGTRSRNTSIFGACNTNCTGRPPRCVLMLCGSNTITRKSGYSLPSTWIALAISLCGRRAFLLSFKNKRILELPAFQAPAWNSVYSLESRIEVTSSTNSSAMRLVRERFTPSGMLMFTITALESSVGAISLLMLLKQKYAPNKRTATIGNNSKRHLRNPPSKREYIPFSQSKNGSVHL